MNFAKTVIALSLLSVLTFPVSAATIRVPQDKPSIQAAVTAASVGDTILLTNGIYNEHGIVVTQSLTFASVNGNAATTINGQNLGGIFQINLPDTNKVLIQGLTITGGTVTGSWAPVRRVAGMLEIHDCVFTQNYANGGVIDARGHADYSVIEPEKTLVIDCVFTNNSAENFAGIVGATAVHCLLCNNTGGNNPCVLGFCNSTNCTVYGNTGGVLSNPWTTGGIAQGAAVNCIFWGNSGYNGQQFDQTAPLTITYSIVQGGYAGTGNLAADPLFVNAASADFHLRSGSPAINAGNPVILNSDGSRSDMGAYGGNFTIPVSVPPSFVTNGLVAYYPFNGSAADASGNGNNANVQGTYQYLTNGALHLIGDNSLLYNGGGYVALPNYGNLNSGFTISIWVANETDHGTSVYSELYVSWDDNAYKHLWLSQHDFLVQDQNTFGDIPLTITDYSPWKQLVLTYSPGNCVAFLNGIMIGSTNIIVSPFPMVNSAIGRHWWNGGGSSSARMTMDVKNFRIYNRALSSNEVAQLYAIELKASQTITFGALPAKTLGDAPFALSASAGSGLPVSYTSGNTNVAIISGSTVTIVGVGTAVITASQAGNSNFLAAADVPESLVVNSSPVFVPPSFLTNGLIAYYPFNGSAADASGNGNDGTVYGATLTTNRFGITNGAYAVQGAADHIAIPVDFKNSQTVTISAWVTLDKGADGSSHNIVSRDDYRKGIIFSYAIDGALGFYVGVGGWAGAEFHFTPISKHWYFVVGTYDQQTISVYLDGNLVATNYFTGGISYAMNGANWIGNGTYGGNAPLNGGIDDVRIYNRALSSNEVAQLYSIEQLKASQAITFGALPTKILGDAPFALSASAGSGLPVTYTSGNTNVATISGSTVTIVGVGTTVITASQAGNSNFLAAADVSQSLIVNSSPVFVSPPFLTNGLVAYYPFNGNANDESGNGNTLTNHGALLSTDRFGVSNRCFYFVNNTLSGPVAGIPSGSSPRTLSLWLETTNHLNTIGDAIQWGLDGSANSSRRFGFTVSHGKPYFCGSFNDLSGNSFIADGNWHHVVITYTNSTVTMFVDGQFDISGIKALNTAYTQLVLGDYVSVNLYYNGFLDDIRIYNRALSSNEVAQLYAIDPKTSQTITFGALPTKTLGDAPFALSASASSGLPVSYTSGNTNVATISGSTVTIVGVGTAVITASQAGNSYRLAATNMSQSLIVNALPDGFRLAAGTNIAAQGGSVVIPVQVIGFSNITSFQFSMHWNPAVASLTGVEQYGLAAMDIGNFNTNPAPSGTLTVSWEDVAGTGVTTTNGSIIFALDFTLVGNPGDVSPVSFDSVPTLMEVVNDQNALPVTVATGQVKIQSTVQIAGTVTCYSPTKAVSGVTLDLTGSQTQQVVAGGDGRYSFTVNPGGNYTVTPSKLAETPASQGVTTADITLIRRHILNIAPFDSPFKLIAADANGSGSVTTADITLIRRLILGISTNLPAGAWKFVRSDFAFADTNSPWPFDTNRVYASIPADALTQDFTAVRVGDVNGSWTSAAVSLRAAKSALSGQQVVFQASQTNGPVGGSAKVFITVAGFTNVTSSQFTLEWDPAVLQFVNTSDFGLTGLTADSFGTALTNSGKLTVSWNDLSTMGVSVADGLVMFSVQFNVIGTNGATSIVTFGDNPTVREVVVGLTPAEFGSQPGRVTVGKPVTFQFSADSSLTVSNGAFRMHLIGITGTGPLIIERSTNLVNWTSVYTNSAPGSMLDFEDLLDTSARARFYRGAFLP